MAGERYEERNWQPVKVRNVMVLCSAAVLLLTACAKGDAGPPPFRSGDNSPAAGATAFASTSAASPSVTTTANPTGLPTVETDVNAVGSWIENFDGALGDRPTDTHFGLRSGGNGWGNDELQSYTERPQNASFDGKGNLAIRAIREDYTGADGYARNWTSARLDTLEKWSFTTGTVSIRMKAPGGAGTWPAFWLLGTDLPTVNWPACGEIDVVEAPTSETGIFQSIHGPVASSAYAHSSQVPAPAGANAISDFHEYAVTRATGNIQFSVDGVSSTTFTPANLATGQRWGFDKPMFITMNLAVGGWAGAPAEATASPSEMLVDWVRYHP